MGLGGQHHAPAAFTPGKNPVPIVQEAGWTSEPVWIDAENLGPTRIRSSDLPSRSESLYRLCHPGYHPKIIYRFIISKFNLINLFEYLFIYLFIYLFHIYQINVSDNNVY
jgi:hypothetical protein